MAELYRIEFSDLNKVEWRISIGDSAHTGTYTLLKATGNPLNFAYDNESDDVFDPMRPSRATFEVYSETNFALLDLYSVEDMHYPVTIYCNEALFWSGYVETQNYEEVYEPAPYTVSITATDGLSILENILYADSIAYHEGEETITYYNGHERESKIILDILGEIGFTEFKEYVNIYEDNMLSTASDSPLDQIKIDRDVFKDYYCYEVLSEILKKYNAIIRQKDGIFCIVRPAELLDATVYGRWFTADTTKTAITLNPDQFLKRKTTHPSSRRIQVPGGRLMIQPPAKKVTSVFDYGYKDSWIDNYELSSKYWNGADFQHWTRSSGTTVEPAGKYVAGMNEGVIITSLNNLSGLPSMTGIDKYISQSFGTEAIASTYDQFYFEFDYLTYNFSGIDIASFNFILIIKSDIGGWYLYNLTGDENFAYWQNSVTPCSFTVAAPNGNSSWTTIKRQISGLPVGGSYTVELYGSQSGVDCYISFKNIRFYVTSDEIIVKRRKHKGPFAKLARWILKTPEYTFKYIDNIEVTEDEYIVHNEINGINMDYDYRLGDVVDGSIDNIIDQCAGALCLMKRTNWYRVDTIVLTGSSGSCDITVGGLSDAAIFASDLKTTASNFVSDNVLAYDAIGITLTSAGSHLIFTSQVSGADFDEDISVVNTSGNLYGNITHTTPAYTESMEPSNLWSHRGESSYKPLLYHIADEIATEYSKPRQLIQMPIFETAQGIQVDLLGNFQDDINTSGGETRVFVANRAEFDVRNRKWEIDLHEIGTRTAESEDGEGGTTTADSTTVTADNGLITVDTI
jgi:hypothetical protein